jgi:glucose 1-dehydrogenase
MRAVTLDYHHRSLQQRDIPEPNLEHNTQVLFRVLEAGVCGTDRELATFHLGFPPPGSDYLVLGHEALGEVIAVGPAVNNIRRGDLVAPQIRRACAPPCTSCARDRRDLCVTGKCQERGINGAHGYFTDLAVDNADDLLLIPRSIAEFGVLLEPLSVVEKAVQLAIRLHEPHARTATVLGAGSVGILAALTLQVRGFEVSVHSLEAASGYRAKLLNQAGIRYTTALDEKADIIIEATGSPDATLQGIGSLAQLGVMVVLGATIANGEIPFVNLVVQNQTIAGSVNASPEAAKLAVDDLARFNSQVLRGLIHRTQFGDFEQSILGAPGERPKIVHVL